MDKQLSKWLQGEISNEELEKSIGSEEAVKLQQIVGEVDKWTPDNSKQLFDPKEISSMPKETKTRSINAWVPYSVAASLVMAIAAYFFLFNNSTVTFKTEIAEIIEVSLPDGSKVHVAPNSEISWNKDDWSQSQVAEKVRLKAKRKVKLKGKALFKVKKGNLFTVNTGIGSVEVMGTTFEVNEFETGMNVVCFEGKVRATSEQGGEVIVNGGDSYLFFDGKWEDRITVNEVLPSWLEDETKFQNAPLAQVIKSLEKLYEINMNIGTINTQRRFTGTIPNNKMEVALKIVFDPFDIKYSRKGDTLYLTE